MTWHDLVEEANAWDFQKPEILVISQAVRAAETQIEALRGSVALGMVLEDLEPLQERLKALYGETLEGVKDRLRKIYEAEGVYHATN